MEKINHTNKNIVAISKSLLKSMGYIVGKNKPIYESETMLKWEKRAATVRNRLGKNKML